MLSSGETVISKRWFRKSLSQGGNTDVGCSEWCEAHHLVLQQAFFRAFMPTDFLPYLETLRLPLPAILTPYFFINLYRVTLDTPSCDAVSVTLL